METQARKLTFVSPAQTQNNQNRRRNIILILADDLGYETIGANGGLQKVLDTLK